MTEQWAPPPAVIRREDERLLTGKLLGEGGFARVYLARERSTGVDKALKVVSKEQLKSSKQRGKLFGEIKIHQAMKHPNILSFEQCFEDDDNVYMQLELCSQGSLLDHLKTRRRFSEPEARFYLVQLLGACEYMHSSSVIHRDLKLGNLMLDEGMNLRVGDFGLAALVKFPGERKKTICGTPNYIAPEILFDTTNGHSFEVDIWSIGVILYTLLIGRPPFQTKEVKQIYRKIKDNTYSFPPSPSLSEEAKDLISSILTTSPSSRPTLGDILRHDFFTTGPFPKFVPVIAGSEDWSGMSKRRAKENFREVVQRVGLLSELELPVGAAAESGRVPPVLPVVARLEAMSLLDPVVEEDDAAAAAVPAEEVERHRPRAVRAASSRRALVEDEVLAKAGVEKEVRKVLQPESPISDLLRSARKPLMVSPSSSDPLAPPQYRPSKLSSQSSVATTSASTLSSVTAAVPGARGSSGLRREVQLEENEEPSAGVPTKPARPLLDPRRPSGVRDGASGIGVERKSTVVPTVARTTVVGKSTAATTPSAGPEPSRTAEVALIPPPVSKPSAGAELAPSATRLPARELYDTTWRALDLALSVTSSSMLSILTRPPSSTVVAPTVFITSWVDYTHKYGTAYSLTDGSAGLYFNDSTTAVLSPDKMHFDYISNRKGNVYSRRHYSVDSHPADLERKAYLLQYFEDYMSKLLLRDVACMFTDVDRRRNMDFLVKYYRMKNAIVFKLSNDVLQFNFYDHTKVLLTHSGSTITFIDKDFQLETFSLHSLLHEAYRPPKPLTQERLDYLDLVLRQLEYCCEVLKSLSARKAKASSAAAGAAAPRD